MGEQRIYPKRLRLRRKGEFRRVLAKGQVYPGRQALVRRARNRGGEARLGIATPRGYGKAVRRNTFRRLAREAFRHVRHQLGGWDYFVSPRRNLETPTRAGLEADLLRTLTDTPAPARPGRDRRGGSHR